MLAENLTITASWTANTYTVTFNAGSGTLVGDKTKTVTYDQAYGKLPTATTTDETLVFLGWFTGSFGGEKVTEDTTVQITADQTLFAHWQNVDTPYDLYIGGTQVKKSIAADVLGDGGTVSYNPKTNTLTLHNYTYSGSGTVLGTTRSALLYEGKEDSLTIVLKGTNKIECVADEYNVYGIRVPYAECLTIKGDGSLEVSSSRTSATKNGAGYGIGVGANNSKAAGKLVIESGTVIARGSDMKSVGGDKSGYNDTRSYGVSVYGLVVSGGSLTAIGGDVTYKTCTATSSGKYYAHDGYSYGILCDSVGEMIVNGGTVTATAGNVTINKNQSSYSNANSYGIYGYLTVNGGDVTATCGTASYVGGTAGKTPKTSAVTSYGTRETVTLGDGVTAVGSTNADGTGAEAYKAKNKDTYKYFRAAKE